MAEGDSVTLLICDDHKILTDALATVVGLDDTLTMVADPVHDPETAIEVSSEHLPDVVLMDIVFKGGGLSGIDATRKIKEVSPSTKVVIMTAHDDDRLLVEAVEAGASGFLGKDEAAQELLSAAKAAADGEVLIDPSTLTRLLAQVAREREIQREATMLLDDLTEHTDQIAEVIGAVARGDLTRTIDLEGVDQPLRGEFARHARAVDMRFPDREPMVVGRHLQLRAIEDARPRMRVVVRLQDQADRFDRPVGLLGENLGDRVDRALAGFDQLAGLVQNELPLDIRKLRERRPAVHQVRVLGHETPAILRFLADDVAEHAAFLGGKVRARAVDLVPHLARHHRQRDQLRMRVVERRPGRGAVILENDDVAEAAILFQIPHPLLERPQHLLHRRVAHRRQRQVVLGSQRGEPLSHGCCHNGNILCQNWTVDRTVDSWDTKWSSSVGERPD